jgi:hypothetical protein
LLQQRAHGRFPSPPNGLQIVIYRDGFYVSNFGASSGDGQVLGIAPVPEPQTYALMALGLAAVGMLKRRRRGTSAAIER